MGLLTIIGLSVSNCSRQVAFAIAPIPAYLPQYFALCNLSKDPILEHSMKLIRSSSFTHTNDYNHGLHSDPQASNHSKMTEGGFSSTSIILLLQSHIFRLQYFLGSAAFNTWRKPDDAKADPVKWDLVTQSIVMIGIQLMLLSAVTRRRRMVKKQKVEDDDNDPLTNNASPNINRRQRKNRQSLSSTSTRERSKKPFIWLYQPKNNWRWDTVYQHMELLTVLTVLTYIFLRQYWYASNSFLYYINAVKGISVLMESCLALPQMLLNYQRKSTQGLSKVMVLGWVLGDILKLAYFLIGSGELEELDGMEGDSKGGQSSMITFVLGSLIALIMDFVVGFQMVIWYPTSAMIEFKEKFRRQFYQFLSIDEAMLQPLQNSRIKKRDLSGDFDL